MMYRKNILTTLITFVISCICIVSSAAGQSVEVQENLDELIKSNQCAGCNLVGANLNRLDLSEADLSGADLTGATFFLSNLTRVNMKNSILRGVQFGGADLSEADLRGADIRGAELKGAYIAGALFEGSFESKAISDDEELMDIEEKVYIQDDSKPKKPIENKKVEIAKRRDFGAVPPSVEVSLEEETTSLKGPSGMQDMQAAPPVKKVQPVGSITIESKAAKQENDISEDIAENESAKQQDIEEAEEAEEAEKVEIVEKSDAVELKTYEIVDDKKSDLQIVTEEIDASNDTSEAPSESEMENKPEVVVEQKKDSVAHLLEKLEETNKCYQCIFTGVNLSGENMEEADLEGADFSNADLENIDFEEANLKDVSFRDANLKNAKFNGADLYKADFTGADLTGADFEDAKIDDTVFTGAKGYQLNIMTQPQ